MSFASLREPTRAHAHTSAHTHAGTRRHIHTRTHAHTHTHTDEQEHTHTHTHTRTHTHTCTHTHTHPHSLLSLSTLRGQFCFKERFRRKRSGLKVVRSRYGVNRTVKTQLRALAPAKAPQQAPPKQSTTWPSPSVSPLYAPEIGLRDIQRNPRPERT
jgi:hypothetical protein